jgi:hypothetical protein
MKGLANGIDALRLEVLNRVVSQMPVAKDLFFLNMFPSNNYPSDSIRWLLEYGTSGMSPFAAPGAPAPVMGDEWLFAEGSARAAFWKEKTFLDEQMLNNLREPLTESQYMTAERQLSRKELRLKTRSDKRREWMIAKMFFDGTLTYQQEKGLKFTIDYGIPEQHKLALTGEELWIKDDGAMGSSAKPVQDTFDVLDTYVDNVGREPEYVLTTRKIIRKLMFDEDIQGLLQKSTFGEGDLFNNPVKVLGDLLGFGGKLATYDEIYEVSSWLTTDLSAGGTDIYVEDATDFDDTANSGVLRIFDMTKQYVWEDLTIESVDRANNKITVTEGPTNSYKAQRDRVVLRRKYMTEDRITMFSTSKEGEPAAEFMNAPFGLERYWGQQVDQHENWDPDGIWLRVRNKGLPVLYHPDLVINFKVGA